MTTKEPDLRPTIELESLLEYYRFHRDNVVETYSERSDLNKEMKLLKEELHRRKKDE